MNDQETAPTETVRVRIIIPTYEPNFEASGELESFYRANFDSYLDPDGDFDWSLVLSDFKSSPGFKTFLREYAAARPERVLFLDGGVYLSSLQAFNMALRLGPYDIAFWAASDTRARSRDWLAQLAADFETPSVVAVLPTVTLGGIWCLPQTQLGPVDQASQPVTLPRFFNLVSGAFHRRLMEPFGHRLCDRFFMGNEKGIMWQIAAAGGEAVLNFRCNLVHDQFHQGGRHIWYAKLASDDRVPGEQATAMAARTFLPSAGGWLPYDRPWRELVRDGWRRRGLWGVARSLIGRVRRPFRHAWWSIRAKGVPHSWIWENLNLRRKHRSFQALDSRTRVKLVEALFMGDPSIYDKADYEVFPSTSWATPKELKPALD